VQPKHSTVLDTSEQTKPALSVQHYLFVRECECVSTASKLLESVMMVGAHGTMREKHPPSIHPRCRIRGSHVTFTCWPSETRVVAAWPRR
jgi:hypothetical protein